MTQFDRNQAEAFLKVIDPGAAGFTFQTFDDRPHKRPELARVFHASIDGAWDDLCRLSQRGAGIFLCINETNFLGRKASDITRVRALFADLDGAPLSNVWDVPLDPGWIARTSPGRYHCFWRVADIALEKFASLQREIIARTGGDRTVHDLPRVMRLPGFPHQVEGKAIGGEGVVNGRDACVAILPPPAAASPVDPSPVGRHLVRLGNGASAQRRYAVAAPKSEAVSVEFAPAGCGTKRSIGQPSPLEPSSKMAAFPPPRSRRP
jgi:hypothetical protein